MFQCEIAWWWCLDPEWERHSVYPTLGLEYDFPSSEAGMWGSWGHSMCSIQLLCSLNATDLPQCPSFTLFFIAIDSPPTLAIYVFLLFVTPCLQRRMLVLGSSWGFHYTNISFKAIPWRYLPGLCGDKSLSKAEAGLARSLSNLV